VLGRLGVADLRKGDVVLPAVLAVVAVLELVVLGIQPLAVAALPSLAACLLLVWRRRWPLVVGPGVGVLLAMQPLAGVPLDEPATQIAILGTGCYALGRYVRDLRGLLGVAAMQASVFAIAYEGPGPSDFAFVGILTLGPWALGRLVLRHERSNAELAATARRLAEEQRRAAEEAVRAERARIARELHDVIAHSLSVMVVQADAAQDLIHSQPGQAARAMTEVAEAGRRALAETGRLLHLIRDDDELGLAPQPRIGDLPELVRQFRESGLEVALDMQGAADDLPPGVELSIYRIVQEGLTNALKHGADGQAQVRLQHRAEEIVVEVRNECSSTGPPPSSGGYGLVGMRERVSVFGGTLRAGPTPEGGFSLWASLPTREDR
jgi:signal transduction histidine kinase